MRKLAFLIGAGMLLLLNATTYAEEHADAALTHANEAIASGKAGNAAELIEHVETSLVHAKKAEQLATGDDQTHIKAGVKALEDAIKHAKLEHNDIATKLVQEAVQHIRAGDK